MTKFVSVVEYGGHGETFFPLPDGEEVALDDGEFDTLECDGEIDWERLKQFLIAQGVTHIIDSESDLPGIEVPIEEYFQQGAL